jgi:hypothetical protein
MSKRMYKQISNMKFHFCRTQLKIADNLIKNIESKNIFFFFHFILSLSTKIYENVKNFQIFFSTISKYLTAISIFMKVYFIFLLL